MIIKYTDGTVLEAMLLSRSNNALRAAVQGDDDARTFTLVSGTWMSEECGPVEIEFAWERRQQADVPTEAGCVCSKKLASHLISMLLVGSKRDELMEHTLWVFSAEGRRVRIQRSELQQS